MNYFFDSFVVAVQLIAEYDPELYQVVWTSLKISLTATVIAAMMGVPIGVLIALSEFPGKRVLQNALNTLMAVPTVMIGLIFYALLTRQGVFGGFGLLYTPGAIILGECVLILPIIVNLAMIAVQAADPRLLSTLQALGANTKQQFIGVLKESRYAIVAAVIMGFGRAIAEVGSAMMLGGNIQGFTRTMTTAIALETSKGEFELGLALGIVLIVIAFSVNIFFQFLQRLS